MLNSYIVFLAYVISYPIQVFSSGNLSGVFTFFCILLFLSANVSLAQTRFRLKYSRRHVYEIACLGVIFISYLVSSQFSPSDYMFDIVQKFGVLTILYVFASASGARDLNFDCCAGLRDINGFNNTLVNFVLIGFPLGIFAVAVQLNSWGRIPAGAEIHPKHFYNGTMRAGAGYVDPNALGLTLICSIAIVWSEISKHEALKYFAIVVAAFASIETYSRGVQITLFLFVLFSLRETLSFRKFALIFVFASFILAVSFHNFDHEFLLLFQRFFNDEGQSSVIDRVRQYNIFFDLLSYGKISNFLSGFGTQVHFKDLAGVHLHSLLGAVVIDAGFIPAIFLIAFLVSIWLGTRGFYARAFSLSLIFVTMVLPFIPELLFSVAFAILYLGKDARAIRPDSSR